MAEGDRVVLGQKEDTFAGFSWSGAEPEGLWDPEVAEDLGAVWEGDERVTYDFAALERQLADTDDEEYIPDVD